MDEDNDLDLLMDDDDGEIKYDDIDQGLEDEGSGF